MHHSSIKRWFPLFFIIGIFLNATCLFNDILEPDGALYATIAKHIATTNDWVNLIGDGHDWLDKPHLPFWLCALSFKCFGINSFAYKLPAFLCWLMGVMYVFKFSKKIYNEDIAKLAVIIYITALHVILANFDVRAEAFLTAFIIAAIYHLFRVSEDNYNKHIIIAAFFCACAVMTKGIFTLVTIVSGFIVYWIFSKQLKQLLQPKWWHVLLLILLFISPELICLYLQFDAHPEKIVFEQTNVSGLKFFFWDSQFGRFFNNGPIKGTGDIFFFTHTFLWAFLPWSFIAVFAFFNFRKNSNAVDKRKLIINASALITFLMFSFSKFQLPHYIVIIFPHIAIITACYLLSIQSEKVFKRINILQIILYAILNILLIWLAIIYKPSAWLVILILEIIVFVFFIFASKKKDVTSITKHAISFSLLLFLFLNLFFYPSLMQYQSGMQAARWLNAANNIEPVTMYRCSSYSFEFYNKAKVLRADTIVALKQQTANKNSIIIYTPQDEISLLKLQGVHVQVLQQFDYFHISELSLKFLKQDTRQNELQKFVLAKISLP